jgi:hypothetical protein
MWTRRYELGVGGQERIYDHCKHLKINELQLEQYRLGKNVRKKSQSAHALRPSSSSLTSAHGDTELQRQLDAGRPGKTEFPRRIADASTMAAKGIENHASFELLARLLEGFRQSLASFRRRIQARRPVRRPPGMGRGWMEAVTRFPRRAGPGREGGRMVGFHGLQGGGADGRRRERSGPNRIDR